MVMRRNRLPANGGGGELRTGALSGWRFLMKQAGFLLHDYEDAELAFVFKIFFCQYAHFFASR